MKNNDNTALLVMDVQSGITSRINDKELYLKNLKSLVKSARAKNIPIIFIVVGFRPGLPEINVNNKSFSAIKKSANLTAMINPTPVLETTDKDIVITKRRVSAFSGSDLEVVLRAQGIHHLVLCGISTSGVVLSTTREAADKDYQLSVLSDLCVDFDEEVQHVLIEKILPRQAQVISSQEWLKTI